MINKKRERRIHRSMETKETLAECALDTLLFLKLAGKSSHVTATCPATGRLVRLTVTEETMNDLDPPGAVLSLHLLGEATSAEHVQATICAYGHFFVDREHASAWATS